MGTARRCGPNHGSRPILLNSPRGCAVAPGVPGGRWWAEVASELGVQERGVGLPVKGLKEKRWRPPMGRGSFTQDRRMG